jgi:hypothetical protein
MFEADWLMKQLSMGVEVLNMSPLELREFEYDPRLLALGLKKGADYDDEEGGIKKDNLQHKNSDWNRLWIVVKNIELVRLENSNEDQRFFEIADIKLGCESRQLIKQPDGSLKDQVDQDPHHNGQKFASKFSEIYD